MNDKVKNLVGWMNSRKMLVSGLTWLQNWIVTAKAVENEGDQLCVFRLPEPKNEGGDIPMIQAVDNYITALREAPASTTLESIVLESYERFDNDEDRKVWVMRHLTSIYFPSGQPVSIPNDITLKQ